MSEFDDDIDDIDVDEASAGAADSDDRVVLYVDGGMDAIAQRAFEAELERSAVLRKDVETARIVRRLVAGLPREKSAMPSFDAVMERLDATPSAALGRLLHSIPRVQPPASLRDRVLRKIPALSPHRLRAMPAGAWARFAAAAIVLVSCGLAVTAGRSPTPPKGPFRFTFERAPQRIVPGFDASAMPRFPASVEVDGNRGDRR